ncbi:MAG: hypothetical protein AB7E04_14670 [Desulfobacteraceae bacterium]
MNSPTNSHPELFSDNSKKHDEVISDITISGYKLTELVHKGNVSKVIRGFDTLKRTPVIIKILNQNEVTPVQTQRFR